MSIFPCAIKTDIFWHSIRPLYLLFIIAFPLLMVWVEVRPLNGPTFCLFRQTTHLECPGCGMTRAFRAMGRLDVPRAFRYNPLGPALFATVVLCWGVAVAQCVMGGRLRSPHWWLRWRLRLLYAGIALYLLVGCGRTLYELRHPPPPPTPLRIGWPLPTLPTRN